MVGTARCAVRARVAAGATIRPVEVECLRVPPATTRAGTPQRGVPTCNKLRYAPTSKLQRKLQTSSALVRNYGTRSLDVGVWSLVIGAFQLNQSRLHSLQCPTL